MKNYYKLRSLLLLFSFIALFSNCKKKELDEQAGLLSNHKNLAVRGDGVNDALGFGYDVTGDYLDNSSVRMLSVIDMERFVGDHKENVVSLGTTGNSEDSYYGGSATNYIHELNKAKSFNVTVSGGDAQKIDTARLAFTGTLTNKKTTGDKYQFNSKYSYATYASVMTIKQFKFTPNITLELLKNYLSPAFVEAVSTQSAETLISWYGTHVLMDFSVGGRLEFDFFASVGNQTTIETRAKEIHKGLGFFVKKIGINMSSDISTSEMTQSFNETSSRQFGLHFKGGTNSGHSVSFDSNGNAAETVNVAAWQSSITPGNATLVKIERMVPLYEFITDPVKKSQVIAAMDKYIADRQITVVKDNSDGSVPFYNHHKYSDGTGHYISPNANESGWVPDGIAFRAFTTQRPGTQPVYEFWGEHNNKRYYFYQFGTSQTTFWHISGVKFFAYPSEISGSVPVYGYMNANQEDHYFTTDVVLGTYWTSKWTAFNVFPAKQ